MNQYRAVTVKSHNSNRHFVVLIAIAIALSSGLSYRLTDSANDVSPSNTLTSNMTP
jgi:hypothetical protein